VFEECCLLLHEPCGLLAYRNLPNISEETVIPAYSSALKMERASSSETPINLNKLCFHTEDSFFETKRYKYQEVKFSSLIHVMLFRIELHVPGTLRALYTTVAAEAHLTEGPFLGETTNAQKLCVFRKGTLTPSDSITRYKERN
jgi:hypothetical protein